MKDEIRILFLQNVGNDLDGETLRYIVDVQDGNYKIQPFIKNEKTLNYIFHKVCYDFDELSFYNQQRYEKFHIQLKRVNGNVYSVEQKTFQKKNQLFT
ncbi:MAG: hypothetical protein MR388_03640 [Tenericutes bacterium]|nr:hypothetical protein [Mycoplasmatota bacterium]